MKRVLLSLTLIAATFSTMAQSSDDKLSLGVSLNHDAFFGFNPMLTGSYKASEKTAFTFYGIQWGAGTGSAWGNWTEVGVGANFTAGNFNINPQIGFTMGSLLSSGAASRGVVGDGIVPNLTINYDAAKFEGQFYGGYYGAFRNNTERSQSTNNYVHYWANAGVKATSWLSIGAHVENLYLSGGATNGGGSLDRADGYTWVGPYVQFKKGSAGMRFSFGSNVADESARFSPNDFYKLAFFFGI